MKSVKNVFLVMSVFLTLALISSCMKPIVITDSGKTYNLPEDSPFQLQLPGNPTTGYVWQLMPYDETVVQQVGEPDYQVNDDKIGSGGMYTYHFKTAGSGATVLYLQYKRKWDTVSPPSRSFEVKIVSGTMGQILDE
ncbi:MAG: protease inhibitor I42 family protein [Bacteroidales bacterium]|nr:protease inhibitor I42 family protein [Bacteroidales bacterium]